MRFEDFIGKPALISHLRGAFGAGRAYHAYIFAGPEGTGKKTMAALCAQALFCEAAPDQRPCGQCPACARVQQGDPDVMYLRVPEDKTSVPVESVRELTEALSDRAFGGGMRAVIVEEADRMLEPAQNALLKTLEEPPEGVVFLLVTKALGSLLPTVVSRCRVVRFSCLPEEDVARELAKRGVPSEQASLFAQLSQGSLGVALAMARDEPLRKLAERVRAAREASRTREGIIKASGILKDDKDEAQRVLTLFEAMGRGEMRAGDADGARLMRGAMDARRRVRSNVSWQYALEQMLLEAAEGSDRNDNGHRGAV